MGRNRITTLIILGVVAIGVLALVFIVRPGTGETDGPSTAADVSRDTGKSVTIELLKEPISLPEFSITDLDGKAHVVGATGRARSSCSTSGRPGADRAAPRFPTSSRCRTSIATS